MILQLSGRKVFNRVSELLLTMLVVTMLCLFVTKFDEDYYQGIGLLVGLMILLPNSYFLIEYLIYTRKLNKVQIDAETIRITYRDNEVFNYRFSEIKNIKFYKSAGMDKGSFTLNIIESYYYAELIFNDGRKLILTSLLTPDLTDGLALLKGVTIERFKSFSSPISF